MDSPCLPPCRAASSASAAAAPLTLMKRLFGRLISLPFVLINEAALARPWGSVKLSTGLTRREGGTGPVLRGGGGGGGGSGSGGLVVRIWISPLLPWQLHCSPPPSLGWLDGRRASHGEYCSVYPFAHFSSGKVFANNFQVLIGNVRSERCTFLMELLIGPGSEIAGKRFRSAGRVLSLTEKTARRRTRSATSGSGVN